MILESFWQALETSAIGDFVATNGWAFPTLETIHVIAITTVIGAIVIMDLRLLGLASNTSALTQVSRNTLPLVWGAFALAAVTGLLLFSSKATSYMINPYFLAKIAMIAVAGLNMILFHATTWKKVADWDMGDNVPKAAKWAGGLSILFWVSVTFLGRAIGFTLGMFY